MSASRARVTRMDFEQLERQLLPRIAKPVQTLTYRGLQLVFSSFGCGPVFYGVAGLAFQPETTTAVTPIQRGHPSDPENQVDDWYSRGEIVSNTAVAVDGIPWELHQIEDSTAREAAYAGYCTERRLLEDRR